MTTLTLRHLLGILMAGAAFGGVAYWGVQLLIARIFCWIRRRRAHRELELRQLAHEVCEARDAERARREQLAQKISEALESERMLRTAKLREDMLRQTLGAFRETIEQEQDIPRVLRRTWHALHAMDPRRVLYCVRQDGKDYEA